MLGLPAGVMLVDCRQLPSQAAAPLDAGFAGREAAKVLGGNSARVFAACVG